MISTVETIVGCMYSGKSEELIRKLKREKIAKKCVVAFKPVIDNRYDKEKIATHNNQTFDSIPIKTPTEIFKYITVYTDTVGIEEVQFFNNEIVEVIERLRNKGIKVICAGLDMDWKGVPFENTIQLMGVSDNVNKLKAICVKCGKEATMSFKLKHDNQRVEVGSDGIYEARCRNCYNEGMQEKNEDLTDYRGGLINYDK